MKKKSKKPEKVFDRYKDDWEHNHAIAYMQELIAVGISQKGSGGSPTILYINYLLEGLRR